MKTVIVPAPGKIEIRQVETPVINAYQALVKTEMVALCNATDSKLIAGKFPGVDTYPLALGHENAGIVVAVGEKVRNFKYGAFKIATLANTPVIPIKFVLEKPTGIYELYKRKPCLHAYILPAIYPDENLEIKDRIADLKENAERIMKES